MPEDRANNHRGGVDPGGVHNGCVYWIQLGEQSDAERGIPHPHVVIQDQVDDQSGIDRVIVCALTSNLKRVSLPGNILLEAGEANLPRQSVVEVSKVVTVDKARLGAYIGSLSARRVDQIRAGMRFLQRSFFTR